MAKSSKKELPKNAEAADKHIKKLTPETSDQYIKDSVVPGLVLRVTPTNKHVWHLRYQSKVGQGQSVGRKYTIGSFDEGMGTRKVRDIAQELRVRIRQGHDPIQERDRKAEERKAEQERALIEARSLVTLNEVADAYAIKLANPVSGHKDGGAGVMALFNNHVLNRFGHLSIKDFRREHLFEAVDAALARGHNRTANAILSNTKSLFRFAVKREYIEYSPIDVLSKRDAGGPDPIRDRVLCATDFKEDELHELYLLLPDAGLSINSEIAIHVLLGTACRVGELMSAKWRHINFEARHWIIQTDESKNGDPMRVYLSDYTLGWLKKLYELSGHTKWLFPSRSKCGHMLPGSLGKQVSDRQKGEDAKVFKKRTPKHSALILPGGHWTVHDLRRTASTQMQMMGVAPYIIDECQNHRTGGVVRRRYQHGSYYEAMKMAWSLLGQQLDSLTRAPARAHLMNEIEVEPTSAEIEAMMLQLARMKMSENRC
ncbi:MAG: tyrosine-type recombinase/integrase [Marinobacter sp.]|nr:tyrosine-type recombinase/integrase [Marinobacter sp.]